jgi:prepilin-type N-terminal cleavage/methylation domain-containing protein
LRLAQKTGPARGFSLIELAIVMAIVALLMGGLMYTLSAQVEQRNFEETRRRLDQARELLLGFAIVNGRLPCPATASSSGDESQTPAASGTCTTGYAGWLPARTIGFQQTDTSGFALDAWGNRIRYAVSIATPYNTQTPQVCRSVSATTPPVTPHFTHKDNLRANGIDCQPNDLLVCTSANLVPPGLVITPTTCGGAANQVMSTSLVVAIVFSTGKNGAQTPCATCIDELANLDGNATFVSHTPTPGTAANGEFDDQFTWITVGELYGKLLAAGVLP